MNGQTDGSTNELNGPTAEWTEGLTDEGVGLVTKEAIAAEGLS